MTSPATAQTLDRLQGLCTRGGQIINTAGAGSSQKAEMVVPSCTVTVYVAGTLTPATIYADRASTPTPKANPFTATTAGEWFFYAAAGRYDVRLSGGTGAGAYPAPVTYGDQWISNPSGGVTPITQAYTTIKEDGTARTQRSILEIPSSSGHTTTDSSPLAATVLSSPRIPTGFFNLVEKFNASGNPEAGTGSVSSGSATLTMNSFPSGYTMATYWKVGQGVLVAGAGAAGADLITTVSAVGATTITLGTNASTTVSAVRVQHDDTAALQAAVSLVATTNDAIQLPDGGYLITSPISIPALSEGKSIRIIGSGGKSGSTIFYQGLGSLFVQATPTTTLDSFELADLTLATSTPGAYSTVRPTVNTGSAIDFSYGQDAVVNYPKFTNLRIIGWGRFGIYCANCQGGWISNTIFRQNASSHVALIAPETLQQAGAAEPNVNSIRDSQFDLAPNIGGADVALTGLSISNGSYILTAGAPSFTSAHLGRLIRVTGAGVLGGDLLTTIKSVDSTTQVTLAAKNQTGGNLSGLAGTISKPTIGSIYLHRANSTNLSSVTIQGNYSGSTQNEFALRADRSYALRASNLWIEDTGGGTGHDIELINSSHSAVITGYKSNADPTASTGNTHGGNLYIRTSKGIYVAGMLAQNPTKHFDLDNQSSITIESSQLSSPDNTFNTFDQSRDRIAVGEGVTYFTGIATGDAQRGTATQYDDPTVQLITNPRFEDGTGGMTGWTDTNPTYHNLVVGGTGRYQRYQQINTSALVDSSSYNVAFQQVVAIPDNYPSRPWTLSYDIYVESFGTTPTLARNAGIDVVASGTGVGYDDFKVQSLNTSNLASGRWERVNYVIYLPTGSSRTFTIRVRTTQGPTTPIIRLANFRLSPGKHNSGTADEYLTSLGGGLVRATDGIRFRETSGTGGEYVGVKAPANIASNFSLLLPTALPGSTLCLSVDTSGNMAYAACSGGGSTTNVRQATNAKVDYSCVGDGVANDTACLSNAITAARTTVNKILYLPGGTYLTDPITQDLQGLVIEGDGELETTIKARTANQPVFNVTGPGQTLNLTIQQLTIEGQGKASGSSGHCAVLGSATSGNEAAFFTIRNVTIKNCGGKGLYMAGQFTTTIEGVTTDEIGDHHIDIQGGNSTTITRSYVRTVEANKVGFRIRGGSVTLIGNNGMDPDSAASAQWGIFGQETALDGADSYFRGTLIGNNIEDFGTQGMEFRTDSYATFDGNTFITSGTGTHILAKFNYVDPTHQGIWLGNNRITLAGGSWANSQPIHARNAPFLVQGDTTFTQFYNFFDATTYAIPRSKATLDPGTTNWLYQFQQLGVGSYEQFTGVTTPGVSGAGNCRIYADSGTNTLKFSCNGAAYADIGAAGSVSLTSTRVAFGSAGNLLTESATFTYNDTTKALTVGDNAAGTGRVNIQGLDASTAVLIRSASIPGSQGGLLMPFEGGQNSFGPGVWWCSGASYASCSGLKLNLGLNWQAPSSTHSQIKLLASTGTSSDGALRIALHPDDGYIGIQPYGASAGNTGEFRTYELLANGSSYIGLKSPDSLAATVVFTLPSADGTSGQLLQTSGAAVTSFGNCCSGQNDTSTGTGAQGISWTTVGTTATRQFTVSANASVTFTFSGARAGQICNLIFIRDATGSAVVNWPADTKWPGGTPITPTAGAAKKDVYQFIYDGTNYLLLGYSADIL